MASPRGYFNTSDGWDVIKNLLLAIASAVVAWAMTEGLDWAQREEWIAPALFPLVFAILTALQRWLSDTRPDASLPTKRK